MRNGIKTEFDDTYDELTTINSSNSRIETYYRNEKPVPFYYNKNGYGYNWEELADCSKSASAPFYNVSGIYLIVNKDSKQAYVGKAANVARRMYDHKRAPNITDCPFLHTAIKHFGQEQFKYTLIEIMPKNIFGDINAELKWFIDKEKYWIKELHTYIDPWNYNLDIGGGNTPVIILHLEDKIKDIQRELVEHPEKPLSKIAAEFDISDRSVVDINRGIGRYGKIKYKDDLTFPIIDTNPDKLDTTKQGWNLNTPETRWKDKLANDPWYYVRAHYDENTDTIDIERFRGSLRKAVPEGKTVEMILARRIKDGFDSILNIEYDLDKIKDYILVHKDKFIFSGHNKVSKIYKNKATGDYWLRLRLKPSDKNWYLGKEN